MMSAIAKSGAPKKSLAARATEGEENGDVSASLNREALDGGREESEDEEDGTRVNIFSETIIEGKRKRFTPVAEGQLNGWLLKNFVAQEGLQLKGGDMYDAYIEHCVATNTPAVESWYFFKVTGETFPNGFTVDKDSPYAETIRVKKKKSGDKKNKADSGNKIKFAEVIREAIQELGNLRKGIRFHQLKNYIAGKHPALQVLDINTERLKKAVLREAYYAHIECVRGIGMCGFYRLPRTAEEEEEERKQEEQELKEREIEKKKKAAAAAGDAPAATDGTGEGEGQQADGGGQEVGQGGGPTVDEGEGQKKKAKKSKHKKQKRRIVVHGEPQRIEDTFPLGMTYNCEPKEASVMRIRKYLADHYSDNIDPEKLRQCLDKGIDSGYWTREAGSSSLTGTFRLTIDEFDPSADTDLNGKVMNAIVACTEPKSSSALQLKKYVLDYHQNFKIDRRPDLFRKAIERAETDNQIVRLSGIGATGSFRLVKSFIPSPTVLQGDDTERDYEDLIETSDKGNANLTVDSFRDAYKPRPSKRHARPNAAHIEHLDPSITNPRAKPKPSTPAAKKRPAPAAAVARGAKQRKVYAESSEEEESEEEEEDDEDDTPKQTNNRRASAISARSGRGAGAVVKAAAAKPSAAKKNNKAAAAAAAAAAATAVKKEKGGRPASKQLVKAPPKPLQKKAAAQKNSSRGAPAAAAAAAGRGRRAAAGAGEASRRTAADPESSDEEDEEEEVVTRKSTGHGAAKKSPKGGSKKGPVAAAVVEPRPVRGGGRVLTKAAKKVVEKGKKKKK